MSRTIFFTYSMRALGAAGAAILTLVMAQLTTAEFVGEYQLVITLALGFSILMRGGMEKGLVKYVAQAHTAVDRQALFLSGLIVTAKRGVLLSLLVMLLSIVVSFSTALIIATVLAIPMSFSALISGYLKGVFKPNYAYIYEMGIVSLVAAVISLLYFVYENQNVFYYSLLASYFILFSLFYRYFNLRRERGRAAGGIKELRAVSQGFMQMTFVIYLQQIFVVISLSYFMSSHDLGVYKVSEKIAFIAGFFQSVVSAIYSPYFSKLYNEKKYTDLKHKVKSAYKMSVAISMPFAIIILIFGKYILSLFGEEYVAGYAALLVLTLAQVVSVMFSVGGMLLNQTEYVHLSKRVVILASIGVLPVIVVLSKMHGAVGAAVAVLSYYLIINLTLTVFSLLKIKTIRW